MFQELAVFPFNVTDYHAERNFIVLLFWMLLAEVRMKPQNLGKWSLYANHCTIRQFGDNHLNTAVDPIPGTSSILNIPQIMGTAEHNRSVNNERCNTDYVQ